MVERHVASRSVASCLTGPVPQCRRGHIHAEVTFRKAGEEVAIPFWRAHIFDNAKPSLWIGPSGHYETASCCADLGQRLVHRVGAISIEAGRDDPLRGVGP